MEDVTHSTETTLQQKAVVRSASEINLRLKNLKLEFSRGITYNGSIIEIF